MVMRQVEDLVAHIPGMAFAVDGDLRVVALSPSALRDLRRNGAEVVGRRCYEVVSAIDTATGLPCRERCPLRAESGHPRWAQSRLLSSEVEKGFGGRLDCLLLKCRAAGDQPANLCFLEPDLDSTREKHYRVMQAVEAVSAVVSSPGDVDEVLVTSLQAVLDATSADGAEVFLVDHLTGEVVMRNGLGLSADTMRALRRSVSVGRSLKLKADSHLPLLAVGVKSGSETDETPGTYLSAPLVAEGRVLGALAIASRNGDFDIPVASRTLFPIAAQLGAYLRRAPHYERPLSDGSGAQTARLRIHCLGRFRLFVDGRPVPLSRFHRFKALTLLKFLVANRSGPMPRESLMELLWPEGDPARTSGNLRVVLHALRRALEPEVSGAETSSFVVSAADLVHLEPSSGIWVDAEEFVRQARGAADLASEGKLDEAIAKYKSAASLYRGEYLQDEPFSDWCLFERERLKEVYINLMKQMASAVAKMGDPEAAIDAYRAALGVDHGREDIHRELMYLLSREGRRDEAVRQYETCRRILMEELAVEPSLETQALHTSMLSGARS